MNRMFKRRWVRIALWVGVIGMALLIFLMSAQQGDDSLHASDFFVKPIMTLIRIVKPDLPAETMDALYWTLQTVVRKAAHMTEYAILAFLIRLLLTSYDWRRPALWGWLFAVAYAATDEMHQSFVAARTAQAADVLVDAAGAVIGVMLSAAVLRLLQRKYKHEDQSEEE